MRKSPFRPDNEISQTFNSGVLTVFSAEDAAKPGRLPVVELSFKAILRYEEQRLGVTRYYEARQTNVTVDRVLRVPAGDQSITPQDVVYTEDGKRYRVDMVQTVPGVWPKCLDLTLYRFEQEAGE